MRFRTVVVAVAGMIAAVIVTERPASACSPAVDGWDTYRIYEDPDDLEPPAKPVVVDSVLVGDPKTVCSGSGDCSGMFNFIITLELYDDVTSSDDVGVIVELVAGSLPKGSNLPEGPVELEPGGELWLTFLNTQTFDFTLEITPVDRAGNQGEPVVFRADQGGGCSVGGPGRSWLLIAMAIAFVAWRRPHRNRRRSRGSEAPAGSSGRPQSVGEKSPSRRESSPSR